MPQPNMIQMFQPEVLAQQAELDRQMQLAQLLRQQSITPIDPNRMVTGAGPARAVPISPIEGLSKLGQAYFAGELAKKNDAKQLEINQQSLQGLIKLLNGGDPGGSTGGPALMGADGKSVQSIQQAPDGMPYADTGSTSTPIVPGPGASASTSSTPNKFGISNLLRGSVVGALGGDHAGTAFWDDQKLTDTARLLRESQGATDPTARAAYGRQLFPPIIARGSPVLTAGPDGKLTVDQSSVDALKTQEEIKGRYDKPVELDTPTGSKIQLSPTEWAEYQKTRKLPMRLVNPKALDDMQADANKTGSTANVNISHPMGTIGGQFQPQSIGVGPLTFNTKLETEEAGRVSKDIDNIQQTGTHAIEKIAQNNKMLELLPSITTGPIYKQITMVQNLGRSLGVDIGDPAPNQEFEKFAIQGALSAAKQIYGARITNQDVTTQIMSNPGATMADKAIYQMLKWDTELQTRHVQKMTALTDYRNKGGDLKNFNTWFAQTYPYQGITAPADGNSAGYQPPGPNMAPVRTPAATDYQQRYGIRLK